MTLPLNRTYVAQLAEFSASLHDGALPPKTVEFAKKCILDSVANILCGSGGAQKKRVMKYVNALWNGAASKTAAVAGESEKYSLDSAIFANAVMARSCDLDDGFRDAMGHPGAVLVPTALAYAQERGCSGEQVILALTVGYEIYARLGRALNPYMYREKGFESTGICGSVAAAAMLGVMDGADSRVIADAMGIAASFTGALIEYQNDGTDGKVLCCGWAALDGLRAYRLASAGFSGPAGILEGKNGFLQAHRGSAMNSEAILDRLGEGFAIEKVYFKRHACMRGLHAAVDAILALREEYSLTPADVASVRVYTTPFLRRLSKPEPSSLIGAQSSLEFALASALQCGHLYEADLAACYSDPAVRQFARRIEIVIDEDIVSYLQQNPTHYTAARVELRRGDGALCAQWSPVPLGDVETPFSFETLLEKLERMICGTSYAEKTDILGDRLRHFEKLPHVELF